MDALRYQKLCKKTYGTHVCIGFGGQQQGALVENWALNGPSVYFWMMMDTQCRLATLGKAHPSLLKLAFFQPNQAHVHCE